MINKYEGVNRPRITTIDTLEALTEQVHSLRQCTIHGLDLTRADIDWSKVEVDETTIFLGCRLELETEITLRRRGAYFYHPPQHLPYRPFRRKLYTWHELLEGHSENGDSSRDLGIYQHFNASRFNPSINEALWQRLHDHGIDDALRELLVFDAAGMTERRCVGFMGGHSAPRTDVFYRKSVETAKLLTEAGYFIVSGGGPGIMEAANLGAYLAHQPPAAVDEALEMLAPAPTYLDRGYHRRALKVLERFPAGAESLAVPTWFYGHEPSNLFASHIAKYFSNSIREDTLLAICLFGIVYAPGSAGTTQEIFMDATQNHYGTYNHFSPMVFLGRRRYEIDTLIYPVLRQLAFGRPYYDLLHLTDEPREVVEFIQAHPPLISS